mmetsp:Transcript_39514/g.111798  ORF Transcript_39514/g.111798 Transcript_39514/m.111798 type:complete len:201 (-) Transcript_39514:217-819(-)
MTLLRQVSCRTCYRARSTHAAIPTRTQTAARLWMRKPWQIAAHLTNWQRLLPERTGQSTSAPRSKQSVTMVMFRKAVRQYWRSSRRPRRFHSTQFGARTRTSTSAPQSKRFARAVMPRTAARQRWRCSQRPERLRSGSPAGHTRTSTSAPRSKQSVTVVMPLKATRQCSRNYHWPRRFCSSKSVTRTRTSNKVPSMRLPA